MAWMVWLSWLERLPVDEKDAGSIPQGTRPGCGFLVRACVRKQPICFWLCVCLSLSPFLFLKTMRKVLR